MRYNSVGCQINEPYLCQRSHTGTSIYENTHNVFIQRFWLRLSDVSSLHKEFVCKVMNSLSKIFDQSDETYF